MMIQWVHRDQRQKWIVMGLVFKLDKDINEGDHRLTNINAAKMVIRVVRTLFFWIIGFLLAAAVVASFVKALVFFYSVF